MGKITKLPTLSFIWIIKAYKFCISPLFGNCCRFHPSCSTYSIMALKKYGFFLGIFLSFKRILRCNPLCKGGIDLIPE